MKENVQVGYTVTVTFSDASLEGFVTSSRSDALKVMNGISAAGTSPIADEMVGTYGDQIESFAMHSIVLDPFNICEE